MNRPISTAFFRFFEVLRPACGALAVIAVLSIFYPGEAALAAETSAKRATQRSTRLVKARILKANYRREKARLGNWRGRVLGSGRTHLFLRFIKNGQVVGKRLIGRVYLENEPNGVLFSYRGAIPQLRHLKWDIVAFSERA